MESGMRSSDMLSTFIPHPVVCFIALVDCPSDAGDKKKCKLCWSTSVNFDCVKECDASGGGSETNDDEEEKNAGRLFKDLITIIAWQHSAVAHVAAFAICVCVCADICFHICYSLHHKPTKKKVKHIISYPPIHTATAPTILSLYTLV